MLLTTATNLGLARFFGKMPIQALVKPLQATGPMVAPATLSVADATVSVEHKGMKLPAKQGENTDQVDKDVSGNMCGTTNIVYAKEIPDQNMEGNQLQNLLEKNQWISERISELHARKFSDPENIPLFRELDFA